MFVYPVGMSLPAIAELVDDLHVAADADELRLAYQVRDKLDARIAVAVAAFEAGALYEDDGAVSMHGWLRAEAGRDPASAARMVTTGRRLDRFPVLRDAVLDGRITGGQLDIVLAGVPARHAARFAEHEAAIVPTLCDLRIDETRKAVDEWRQRADALDDGKAPAERENQLYLSKTLDNRGELKGSFDADATATIATALRVAMTKEFDRPLVERRADALVQVCQHFLDHQRVTSGGRHRPHVNVVIDADDLESGVGGRYLETDQALTPVGLGVLRCDSVLHRLLWSSQSGILDYGRAARQWPVDLYNAIAARDGGCRIPGCDAPPSWCDVHHVVEWEHGGRTSADNVVMACRRHHHLIHRAGYHVKLLPDATVEVTHPDGRVRTSRPRGPAVARSWQRTATAA